ncbi:MAG: hypothetical protein ABIG84_04780 [archaeon]
MSKLLMASVLIIAILFPVSVYALNERIVSIYDEEPKVIALGDTEKVDLIVKNVNGFNTTVDIYIGSDDPAFRNWIWLENHRYGENRVHMKAELSPHEERSVIVNVFGGRTGKYHLIVGPDGSNIDDRYDSTEIIVVNRNAGGMYSSYPDGGFIGIMVILVVAAKVLLRRTDIIE